MSALLMPPDAVVSVVMAARDAASTIGEAIESVRAQTLSEWELLVVDDCSGDATRQIVEAFRRRDHRIRLLDGPCRGVAATRNVALREARGRWIAILDADDWCVPERFERQVASLEAHPGAAAVASRAVLFADPGIPMGLSAVDRPSSVQELEALKASGELLVFCHSTLMWAADRLNALGGYDERFDQGEDAELVNRAVYEHGWPILVEPVPLVWYRITGGGLSSRGLVRQRTTLRYLEERNRSWLTGEQPVDYQTFLDRPRSLATRWRWWRHDTAAVLYRRAGLRSAGGSPISMMAQLMTALVLHPRYVVRKLWRQRVRADARQVGGVIDGSHS